MSSEEVPERDALTARSGFPALAVVEGVSENADTPIAAEALAVATKNAPTVAITATSRKRVKVELDAKSVLLPDMDYLPPD